MARCVLGSCMCADVRACRMSRWRCTAARKAAWASHVRLPLGADDTLNRLAADVAHHGVKAGVGDLIVAVLGAGAGQVFLCAPEAGAWRRGEDMQPVRGGRTRTGPQACSCPRASRTRVSCASPPAKCMLACIAVRTCQCSKPILS